MKSHHPWGIVVVLIICLLFVLSILQEKESTINQLTQERDEWKEQNQKCLEDWAIWREIEDRIIFDRSMRKDSIFLYRTLTDSALLKQEAGE